jgi:hypothetical protein
MDPRFRHAGALALALALLAPLTTIMGCPFHEETFHRDCATATDCDDGNPCTDDECNGGICANPDKTSGALCSGASMDVCDGEGHCVECVSTADCLTAHPTDPICDLKLHKCVSCTDGVEDGLETGVDCGGPDCGACLGAPCVMHMYGECGDMTTCVAQSRDPDNVCCSTPCNGICEGCVTATSGMPDGTCGPVAFQMDPYMDCTQAGTAMAGGCGKAPNTCACDDGAKDGSETDVDCGGGTCPGCAGGKMCESTSDCATGVCTPSKTCCKNLCNTGCVYCDTAGDCVPAIGQSDPTVCTSGGVCGPVGAGCVGTAGATCKAANGGTDCLSGVCTAGTCAKSVTGSPCNTTADCTTGTCQSFVCM